MNGFYNFVNDRISERFNVVFRAYFANETFPISILNLIISKKKPKKNKPHTNHNDYYFFLCYILKSVKSIAVVNRSFERQVLQNEKVHLEQLLRGPFPLNPRQTQHTTSFSPGFLASYKIQTKIT